MPYHECGRYYINGEMLVFMQRQNLFAMVGVEFYNIDSFGQAADIIPVIDRQSFYKRGCKKQGNEQELFWMHIKVLEHGA